MRRHQAQAVPWELTDDLWQLIWAKLQVQWSPERIAAWLRREGPASISFSRIYQRIREDRRQGGQLYMHLRGSKRKGETQRVAATIGQK